MAFTAAKVAALITKLGRDAVIRTYPNATFDADTNSTTLGSPVDYNVKIVPPYKNVEGFKPSEFIESGKGLAGIANDSLAFAVVNGLRITVNNTTWTVTGVTPVSSSIGIIYYQLSVESGG